MVLVPIYADVLCIWKPFDIYSCDAHAGLRVLWEESDCVDNVGDRIHLIGRVGYLGVLRQNPNPTCSVIRLPQWNWVFSELWWWCYGHSNRCKWKCPFSFIISPVSYVALFSLILVVDGTYICLRWSNVID